MRTAINCYTICMATKYPHLQLTEDLLWTILEEKLEQDSFSFHFHVLIYCFCIKYGSFEGAPLNMTSWAYLGRPGSMWDDLGQHQGPCLA